MDGVSLTPAQMRCLFVGPWAFGFDIPQEGVTIASHKDGWIYLEPNDLEEGGAGVMVDPEGVVHYSPPAREQTGDPWWVSVVSKTDEEIIVKVARR